jgi:hypothetical protein
MTNGYQCFREGGYLFAIALFDEREDDVDEISDRVMRELALHRPKTYAEARITLRIDHIVAIYDSLSPKYTIVELSNGFQHRIKAPYDYVQHTLTT